MALKIINILTGWAKHFKLVSTSEAEIKMQELRLAICKDCIHAKQSKVLKLVNGTATHEDDKYCDLCTCPLTEKTIVADEKCPINNW
jgi:hypothetical protein